MPKAKHPTVTKIKKIVNPSIVDFNKPGPMAVIAESSDEYLLERSIEFLKNSPTPHEISRVISLLGLYLARQ